jgi:hypothetical protein
MEQSSSVNQNNEDVKALEWGLTKECVDDYCNKIRKKATLSCGVSEDDLKMNAVMVDKKLSIEFSLRDHEKLNCIEAILEETIPSMPVTTRTVFEHLLHLLKKR